MNIYNKIHKFKYVELLKTFWKVKQKRKSEWHCIIKLWKWNFGFNKERQIPDTVCLNETLKTIKGQTSLCRLMKNGVKSIYVYMYDTMKYIYTETVKNTRLKARRKVIRNHFGTIKWETGMHYKCWIEHDLNLLSIQEESMVLPL